MDKTLDELIKESGGSKPKVGGAGGKQRWGRSKNGGKDGSTERRRGGRGGGGGGGGRGGGDGGGGGGGGPWSHKACSRHVGGFPYLHLFHHYLRV